MGYAPPRLVLSRPGRDPRGWPAWYVADLQTTVRKGRYSWFRSRRRQAHEAVLHLIAWREAHIWPPDDLTADPTWSSMIVADAPPWSSMAAAALSPCETPPPPPRPLAPTYVKR